MKKITISSICSITSLLVLSFISSLIFSILQYNKGIQINNIVIEIVSLFIFFISGFIFGLINKKQGLIGSLIFILVYLLFTLIFKLIFKDMQINIIFIILKCFCYSIACVLSVNLKTK